MVVPFTNQIHKHFRLYNVFHNGIKIMLANTFEGRHCSHVWKLCNERRVICLSLVLLEDVFWIVKGFHLTQLWIS